MFAALEGFVVAFHAIEEGSLIKVGHGHGVAAGPHAAPIENSNGVLEQSPAVARVRERYPG